MAKVTMKEKVLQFVESKGSASFTEIQRFIVDENRGEGTYDAAAGTDLVWDYKKGERTRKANPYRGNYSSAFYKGHGSFPWSKRKDGYFLRGANRLVKGENGKYTVVRES